MEVLAFIIFLFVGLVSLSASKPRFTQDQQSLGKTWIQCPEQTPDHAFDMTVLRVIDGDSLKVRIAEVYLDDSNNVTRNHESELRLRDIDAPEFFQRGGQAAKKALERVLKGKNLKAVVLTDTDYYGRLLATVYLDDRNISLEMVANGLAWIDTKYNKDQKYWRVLKEAQSKKLGIWDGGKNMPPWIFRKLKRKS